VNLFVLSCVCPECNVNFELRGGKLRQWVHSKKIKPDRKGPFCNYKCSRIWSGKMKRKEKVKV